MTEEQTPGSTGGDVPEAAIAKRRGVSLIWLIPVVAALFAAYLAYDTITSQGPTITIYFETGEGLEAGKTKVKFKSIEVGVVDSVALREEKPQVVVTCSLDKQMSEHVGEGARFWVVRPRVGFGGISGLGTLLSGAYINFVPGAPDAPSAREFVGLETPPISPEDADGLKLVLHAHALGSLDPGTPIYYRQIRVGTVEGHQLSKDASRIDFDIYIEPEYARLVRTTSRFLDTSGIEVSTQLGKLGVRVASLEAILSGGVTFDSPGGGKPAPPGTAFWLHRSLGEVEEMAFRYGGLAVVVEAAQLGGLRPGAPVYYKEERVGSVVSQELSHNSKNVRIHLNIQKQYAPLVRANSVFWNASGITGSLGLSGVHIHTESLEALLFGGMAFATPDRPGPRVKPGSVFKLHPEVQDAWLGWSPSIWRGPPGEAPAAAKEPEHRAGLARFFHHEGKSEEAGQGDGEPHGGKHHGFLHGLFHRGGDGE